MKKLALFLSLVAMHAHGMDLIKENDQTQVVRNKSAKKVRIEIQQTTAQGTTNVLSNLHPDDSVTVTAENINKIRIVLKDSATDDKLLSREFTTADILTIKAVNNKLDIQATVLSNKPESKKAQEKYDTLQVTPRITRKSSSSALKLAQEYSKLEEAAQKTVSERVVKQNPLKDPHHRKIDSITTLFNHDNK
ncbi:hypothetical protein Noda2021_12280 [Candidatus Dependentiae bacterium Noda2021]|nr:hypothetical protein Noda2021_12280 [Candidatus Dependentiae bacterium Noda2021]